MNEAFNAWYAQRVGKSDATLYPSAQDVANMPTPHEVWDAATKAERERCAKVAHEMHPDNKYEDLSWSTGHWEEVVDKIAAAIRAGDEGAQP